MSRHDSIKVFCNIEKIFYILGFFVFMSQISVHESACTFETNIDYFGNDLAPTSQNATSPEACCNLCENMPVCQAWTYVILLNQCWLKYAVGSLRLNSEGRVSGIRQQPSPFPPLFSAATIATPTTTTTTTVIVPTTTTTTTTAAIVIVTAPSTTTTTTLAAVTPPSTTTSTTLAIVTAPSTTTSATIVSAVLVVPCFIENNVNYPGNDLPASGGNIANAADCCTKCGNTPGCVSFAYHIQSQYCFLKSAIPVVANRQNAEGIVSGLVRR